MMDLKTQINRLNLSSPKQDSKKMIKGNSKKGCQTNFSSDIPDEKELRDWFTQETYY